MPGPVSDSHRGAPDDGPYVPSWCYDDQGGPRMCKCGHHEGYHNDYGVCIQFTRCKCLRAEYAAGPATATDNQRTEGEGQ